MEFLFDDPFGFLDVPTIGFLDAPKIIGSLPAESPAPPSALVTIVQRNQDPVPFVEHAGALVACVDYLRRDGANTVRDRRAEQHRLGRPRYLNVLVQNAPTDELSFDLFTSGADLALGECVGRNLDFAVEKGQLARVCVSCIDPARFPRTGTFWFAMDVHVRGRSVAILHFMMTWWKQSRKAPRGTRSLAAARTAAHGRDR